jgi:hypothetical protein
MELCLVVVHTCSNDENVQVAHCVDNCVSFARAPCVVTKELLGMFRQLATSPVSIAVIYLSGLK